MKNNLYTISAHLPFADTLANWVLERFGGEPLALARCLIFLPSRRAALELREAFLRANAGRPLLLPRIEPLGDAEEDALLLSPLASLLPQGTPSESFTLRRLFLLARLVKQQGEERMDFALKLAAPLAELLDEMEREEVSLEAMEGIVPEGFAKHWQTTVEFLKILSVHWPKIAAEEGLMSQAGYNAQVLKGLARYWRETPPDAPVIAAGTTASNPATAELLGAIAGMRQGFIVLPGLDTQADEAYFEALEESHPQWGMAQLLKKLKVSRADVGAIGEKGNERVKLISEVMRPAMVSDQWRHYRPPPQAARGLQYIACENLQEEAGVIALMLREALETPGRTAALVTHNRALSRRVAANLRRFGVAIDDSAGFPLKQTPLMAFMRLVLQAASDGFAAVPLLSLLKHPLTHAGMERIACLEAARELETQALRGLKTAPGIDAVYHALHKNRDASPQAHLLLDRLKGAFAPLVALISQKEAGLGALTEAHLTCAQALASADLWEGPEGEASTQFFREIKLACAMGDIRIETKSYPGTFEELLAGKVYRPDYGGHPRLKILSPMEARMQAFDRVILGGMNEGSWPPKAQSDPWFSRPMRAELTLPTPERRAGLAAHDFFMLACAPDIVLTRSGKEDGVPTQASRWLTRLLMLTGGLESPNDWSVWAALLDEPERVIPARRPEPTPPLHARPREISVTRVETWMRDPYALYASQILHLKPLEELAREPGAPDFGMGVHAALERFVRAYPERLPADALPRLLAYGKEVFSELFAGTGLEILWWPRFERIARWVIAQDEERRTSLLRILSEAEGSCLLGDFRLKGRADRIEVGKDGSLTIIDYKTGTPPGTKDIESGLASQLVLLALIAREKGFGTSGAGEIGLEYWQLKGAQEAGIIDALDPDKIDGYIETARVGLARLIARFSDASFPYQSRLRARKDIEGDYDHLARVKEWG